MKKKSIKGFALIPKGCSLGDLPIILNYVEVFFEKKKAEFAKRISENDDEIVRVEIKPVRGKG